MEKVEFDQFKSFYLRFTREFQSFGYTLETDGDNSFLVDIKDGKKYKAVLSKEGKGFTIQAQIDFLPFEAIIGEDLKMSLGSNNHLKPLDPFKELQYANDDNCYFFVRDYIATQDNGKTKYECSLRKYNNQLEFSIDVTDFLKTLSSRRFLWDSKNLNAVYGQAFSYDSDYHSTNGWIYFANQYHRIKLIAEKYRIGKNTTHRVPLNQKNDIEENIKILDILLAMMHDNEVSELTNGVFNIMKSAFLGLDKTFDNVLTPYYGAPSPAAIALVTEVMKVVSINNLKPLDILLPSFVKHL